MVHTINAVFDSFVGIAIRLGIGEGLTLRAELRAVGDPKATSCSMSLVLALSAANREPSFWLVAATNADDVPLLGVSSGSLNCMRASNRENASSLRPSA